MSERKHIANPVLLTTFPYLSDALVLRTRLEYEGIPVLIPEEYSASIAPHLTAMTVRVLVDAEDLKDARRLLTGVDPDETSPETEKVENPPGSGFRCDRCGGEKTRVASSLGQNIFRFIAGILGSVPMRPVRARRVCAQCGAPASTLGG
jgi:hypothetical protein